MKSLGIDYGTKKVGLAMSDREGLMAFPLKIIKNDQALIENISTIILENTIEKIFVGKSLGSFGEENKVQKDIDLFIGKLKKITSVPVETVIESFTSSHGRIGIDKSSLNERKTKQVHEGFVDAKAATLILQRGLDKNTTIQ